MKCLYTDAWSMGNKKEELKTTVQLENCDLIAIMETWKDGSHSWNASTEGYKLFRRDRQGRRGRGVALCVRKGIDCKELPLRKGHRQAESLWVNVKAGPTKDTLWSGFATG